MKKNQREQERARSAYVPPRVEVCLSEPSLLLAGTTILTGDAGEGVFGDITAGSAGSGNVEVVTSAKILGREFRFSDVWDE